MTEVIVNEINVSERNCVFKSPFVIPMAVAIVAVALTAGHVRLRQRKTARHARSLHTMKLLVCDIAKKRCLC
jgi:hypothetical protein